MQVTPTALPGVLILEPKVFGDERGFFMESFNQRAFDAAVGHAVTFVQDNHSCSQRGVLRGLHYQLPPHAQGKLVRVVRGSAFDVAVDIRRGSVDLRPLGRRDAGRHEPPPDVDPAGLRARLPGARRRHAFPLQDHRLLRPRLRTRDRLERPGDRHRLAQTSAAPRCWPPRTPPRRALIEADTF